MYNLVEVGLGALQRYGWMAARTLWSSHPGWGAPEREALEPPQEAGRPSSFLAELQLTTALEAAWIMVPQRHPPSNTWNLWMLPYMVKGTLQSPIWQRIVIVIMILSCDGEITQVLPRCNPRCLYVREAVQFSSVAQSFLTLCDPTDHSIPVLPVHHQLPEFTQTHVYWFGDATQTSHPLSSPSPPAFNLSQNQGLFKWVSSSQQVVRVLEFQLQHQSFQWTLRTDLL